MTTSATEKQINFIKKLDPAFNEFEGLDKIKASRIIAHLLKVQKEEGAPAPATVEQVKPLSTLTIDAFNDVKKTMSTAQIKSAILKILKSYGLNASLKLSFKAWYESAELIITDKSAFLPLERMLNPDRVNRSDNDEFTQLLIRYARGEAEESASVWLNNINILNYLYYCYKNDLSRDKIGLTADFINVVQVMAELFERLGIEEYQQHIYIIESTENKTNLRDELNSCDWDRLASALPATAETVAKVESLSNQRDAEWKSYIKQCDEKREQEKKEQAEQARIYKQKKADALASVTVEDCDLYFENCSTDFLKNSSYTEFLQELKEHENDPERVYIITVNATKKVNFLSAEALETFKNNLMDDWDFLQGVGGCCYCDVNTLAPYNIPEESRFNLHDYNLEELNIITITNIVLICLNGEPVFSVDPEGFSYARYCVALPQDLKENELKQTSAEPLQLPDLENVLNKEESKLLKAIKQELTYCDDFSIYNFRKASSYSSVFLKELAKIAKYKINDGLSLDLARL